MRERDALTLLAVMWVAGCAAGGLPHERQVFWDRLDELCGQAFEGRLVEAPPADDWWEAGRLVMHVRECSDDEIRIALHVDDDRSRTWVVSRTAAGLRLEHDHRLRDGTPDEANTGYGGDTRLAGSVWRQEFPADGYSVGAVPARASQLWYLEIRPGEAFAYGLRREASGLRYRIEFDLTRPAESPPPPWGAPGSVTERVATDPARSVPRSSWRAAREEGRALIRFFYVPSGGFAYRDEEGTLTGVTVELLRDFARHVAFTHGIDLEVEWAEEPRWADFYGYVRESRGGAFGIGNVTITDARRDELDFSPPYMNNVAVLVTHGRVPELGSLDRIGEVFRELAALSYPGTLHEARLEALRRDHFPEMRTRDVASNDELVSLLASDGGYFGYIDVYNYWRARAAGEPLLRHPVGDDDSEAFGVILPRGSDWTPVLEEFFMAGGGYVESERFGALKRLHLGEELAALLAG